MHILLATFVYYLAGSVIAGSAMGAGFATNFSGRPKDRQLELLRRIGLYIPLQLDGIDGGLIAKAGERRPTILYLHGRSANRMELAPLAQVLFNAGYNAVLWDSKSRQISYGPREIEEVRRILNFIRNDSHVVINEIYIVGFSLGAAIAIGAASADNDHYIRGIVADSPYADLKDIASRYVSAFGAIPTAIAWPTKVVTFATARALHGIDSKTRNPVDWAERVLCPVLLIHGKADKRIPPQNSEIIFDRLQREKDLWLVDKAGHTQAFKTNPAEYTDRVLKFLNR
jgi:dipeptidyl aminopeptidase/acylaminoacyl peptidase